MSVSQEHSQWEAFFRYNPASRHRRRLLRKLMSRLSFKSVLDVGCGNGQLLSDLFGLPESRRGLRLSAVDLNHTTTPPLLSQLGAEYHCLNLEAQSLSETFDLIIASEVIEHTQDDRAAAMNLAKMATHWLVVTVPADPVYPSDRAMGHHRHYSTDSLRQLLEGAGFKTRACFAWGYPFHVLYRFALNANTEWSVRNFGHAQYTFLQILLCHLLYGLFFFNMPGRGRQLFYVGER